VAAAAIKHVFDIAYCSSCDSYSGERRSLRGRFARILVQNAARYVDVEVPVPQYRQVPREVPVPVQVPVQVPRHIQVPRYVDVPPPP